MKILEIFVNWYWATHFAVFCCWNIMQVHNNYSFTGERPLIGNRSVLQNKIIHYVQKYWASILLLIIGCGQAWHFSCICIVLYSIVLTIGTLCSWYGCSWNGLATMGTTMKIIRVLLKLFGCTFRKHKGARYLILDY